MTQSFAIRAPELAGFSVLGGTAGASLSSWLLAGSDAHVAASSALGAIILPLICTLPQSIAATGRWVVRQPQFASMRFGSQQLAKGNNPA